MSTLVPPRARCVAAAFVSVAGAVTRVRHSGSRRDLQTDGVMLILLSGTLAYISFD